MLKYEVFSDLKMPFLLKRGLAMSISAGLFFLSIRSLSCQWTDISYLSRIELQLWAWETVGFHAGGLISARSTVLAESQRQRRRPPLQLLASSELLLILIRQSNFHVIHQPLIIPVFMQLLTLASREGLPAFVCVFVKSQAAIRSRNWEVHNVFCKKIGKKPSPSSIGLWEAEKTKEEGRRSGIDPKFNVRTQKLQKFCCFCKTLFLDILFVNLLRRCIAIKRWG